MDKHFLKLAPLVPTPVTDVRGSKNAADVCGLTDTYLAKYFEFKHA